MGGKGIYYGGGDAIGGDTVGGGKGGEPRTENIYELGFLLCLFECIYSSLTNRDECDMWMLPVPGTYAMDHMSYNKY